MTFAKAIGSGVGTQLKGLKVTTSGSTSFNGPSNKYDGPVEIASGEANIVGTFETTSETAGTVTINNSGNLNINEAADMTLTGVFLQSGAGTVYTAGEITTTNDNIEFYGDVMLTGAVTLDTGSAAGYIKFN